MKPKIGIIGTGQTVGIAHYHALGILADRRAEISAVYDINKAGAEAFVSNHNLNSRVCDSLDELLELVDAVDICTPNFTHIQYVLSAVKANKAVFVEKPLALSANESYQAVKALEGKNLFNMVGFVYRYSNLFKELQKLVKNELGSIYTFDASFGGKRIADPNLPLEWRMIRELSGTGALGDFGSHLIDSAYFLAGLKFKEVSCFSSIFIPERPANIKGETKVENDDASVFIARAETGAIASFTMSRVGMDEISICLAGEGGLVRLSMKDNDKFYFSPKDINGGYKNEIKEIQVPYQKPFEGWFESEMTTFIDGLLGNCDNIPDIKHGYYVESVITAAEQSSKSNSIVQV